MLCRTVWHYFVVVAVALCLSLFTADQPAIAGVDPYITRYLRVTEPISLVLDNQGNTRSFSAQDLSQGKLLFEKNCLSCHVGGTTLPNPSVPLSLEALQDATPPRNNINSLLAFLRQPMVYNGSEESFLCQQISESWMPTPQVEAIAAFVLRAAEKAPGWGTETFQD